MSFEGPPKFLQKPVCLDSSPFIPMVIRFGRFWDMATVPEIICSTETDQKVGQISVDLDLTPDVVYYWNLANDLPGDSAGDLFGMVKWPELKG